MKKEEIEQICDKILNVALLIETVRDASLGIDNSAHFHVLNIALNEQENIYDKISLLNENSNLFIFR